MRRLLLSREFPPAPGGGIGTYARHIAEALVAAGDTVHVISQRWPGAEAARHEAHGGRLVVHRVPVERPVPLLGRGPHRDLEAGLPRALFGAGGAAAAFAWQAALLAEELVEREAIELIEAPEYEAPLVFFQQRRAAGMGPAATPPCVVHLHSPSEFIAQANDWDPASWTGAALVQQEWASIRAADALICPSRYLARAVATRIGRAADAIEVLRYPLGPLPVVPRDRETWRHGTVLYVGRLELRKGILEWLDAAVELATTDATMRFTFVGSNHLDAQLDTVGVLADRIPAALRPRFAFHPHRAPAGLAPLLAEARLAVVPSRWENFPYTCLEAMASGLPVVVSPTGGMAEMVDDSRTGWIAASQSAEHLTDAVREALDRSPSALAEAGAAAAAAVRTLADPARVAARHRDLADRLVRRGARRSLSPPHVADDAAPRAPLSLASDVPKLVCAIVVEHARDNRQVTRQSIRAQAPAARELPPGSDGVAAVGAEVNGWLRTHAVLGRAASGSRDAPDAVAFIPAGTQLAPDALHRAAMVLRRHPRVAVVSGWLRTGEGRDRLVTRPDPTLPHQWLRNDVPPVAVYRASALRQLGGLREELAGPALFWDLANALLVAGWGAVTLPELFATVPARVLSRAEAAMRDEALRQRLMDRFPAAVARHAMELGELRALEGRHGAIEAPTRLARIGRTLRRGARRPWRTTGLLARNMAQQLFAVAP